MAAYYFDPQNDYFDRDCPMSFRWFAPGMAEALRLQPAPNAAYELVRDSILADLWLAAEAGKALSYSRHEPFYKRSRYRHGAFTFGVVLSVVAEIVGAGLALENRTAPGHRGWQSKLTATPALYNPGKARDLIYKPAGETLILRGRGDDRALIHYDDTRRTILMRREVAAVREMHASTMIGVPGGMRVGNHLLFERLDTGEYGSPVLKRQYVRVDPDNGGRRIFTENWSQHGRFYCWPQNIPSAERATMTINGQPVSEPDFSAMHPMMLYSEIGSKFDGNDPYDVSDEFGRDEVKIGMVISINAKNNDTAVKALARERKIPRDRSQRIINAIRARHAPIERSFCSDAGIRLMNLDSKIAMAVTTGLMADGIHSIPIHDSIVVQAKYAGQTRDKMDQAWKRYCGASNPCAVT